MKVHLNEKQHLQDFVHLNHQWIEKYFELEEADKKLAQTPERIIEQGGYIISITENDQVVGVCALFSKGDGYELARMAVSDSARGKGYGRKLMHEALLKLEEIGADKVRLYSNTILKAAINLYKSCGFETVFEGPHADYARCNIIMDKLIST